jgi:hypothetical protein
VRFKKQIKRAAESKKPSKEQNGKTSKIDDRTREKKCKRERKKRENNPSPSVLCVSVLLWSQGAY